MPWCRGCASRYRIEPWYRALGRLGRSGRRQSRTPPARDLEAGDKRREPQHSRGVPTHHGDLRAPAVDPEKREHVGEHTVPDERGHRVPARKAPAEVLEEYGGTGRPRAANHELEHHIEQAAAGERREPAGEHDPLTTGRKEEGHCEC